MPSPVVIRAENVSKQYVISRLAKQQTIRDAMHHGLRLLWRRLRWNAQLQREEFWALKDVSFEVKQGEVLGIIGRNGAGKSTLLKILSRITEPTTGRISLNGRVASLLEVGTGFHPELTGRENIFLNGAILGMTRAEVRGKLDEIVAFAEIDQFIDTPVKRYSSGMYVRLAFAVAAHLEPEILIIDEVLAVGDATFQDKCLGKLQTVSSDHGRTVLFVSHNISAIRQLTARALLLETGRANRVESTDSAIEKYRNHANLPNKTQNVQTTPTWGKGKHATIIDAQIIDLEGNRRTTFEPHKPVRILLQIESDGSSGLSFELFLRANDRHRLAFFSLSHMMNTTIPAIKGKHQYTVTLAPLPLAIGTYSIDLATSKPHHFWDHQIEDAINLEIARSPTPKGHFTLRDTDGLGHISLVATELQHQHRQDQQKEIRRADTRPQ